MTTAVIWPNVATSVWKSMTRKSIKWKSQINHWRIVFWKCILPSSLNLQSERVFVSETLFVLLLSSFRKKQLDTVELIKATQQPITNRDFRNRATLSQSEFLGLIIDLFYPPIRNLCKEWWKRPMRKQICCVTSGHLEPHDFWLKMCNKTRKLLYRDVQSVSRVAGVALRNSIPLSLSFFSTSHH